MPSRHTDTARESPSFKGLSPASLSSSLAMGANRSRNTRAELALRHALWRMGMRYRLHSPSVPGRPDLVFCGPRTVVFCDGDFWHGRDWPIRAQRLSGGSNAAYWTAKIARNMRRDEATDKTLIGQGWLVLHLWETDILQDPLAAGNWVMALVHRRSGSQLGRDQSGGSRLGYSLAGSALTSIDAQFRPTREGRRRDLQLRQPLSHEARKTSQDLSKRSRTPTEGI